VLSPPFAAREFNGEQLLEELDGLADGGVTQQELEACWMAVRSLELGGRADAASKLRALASSDFRESPELAGLLRSWAAKIRTDDDVPCLVGHFQRMALVSALSSAAVRASRRLGTRGRSP
jgi:hypothetical protein